VRAVRRMSQRFQASSRAVCWRRGGGVVHAGAHEAMAGAGVDDGLVGFAGGFHVGGGGGDECADAASLSP